MTMEVSSWLNALGTVTLAKICGICLGTRQIWLVYGGEMAKSLKEKSLPLPWFAPIIWPGSVSVFRSLEMIILF
jgi:hypothetical protein